MRRGASDQEVHRGARRRPTSLLPARRSGSWSRSASTWASRRGCIRDHCNETRSARRSSHHAGEFGADRDRLSAVAGGGSSIDGPRPPAEEHGVDGKIREDVRLPIVHRRSTSRRVGRSPRFQSSLRMLEGNRRSIDEASTRGKTPASLRQCEAPGDVNSSSALCGRRSVWRFRRSTLYAKGFEVYPSSTRFGAHPSKRIAPVWNVSRLLEDSR